MQHFKDSIGAAVAQEVKWSSSDQKVGGSITDPCSLCVTMSLLIQKSYMHNHLYEQVALYVVIYHENTRYLQE